MLTAAVWALSAPLAVLWAVVVLACARDALAPLPVAEPVPYVRTHAVAQYRARRDAADAIAWAAT